MSKAGDMLLKTEGSLVKDVRTSDAIREGIKIAIQSGVKLEKKDVKILVDSIVGQLTRSRII